jgi:hypothetical protein
MTTKDDNNGKPNLSTAGSRVRLRLVKDDDLDQPQRANGLVDKGPDSESQQQPLKSKSPLVSFMSAYADAIDRQVAELINGLV